MGTRAWGLGTWGRETRDLRTSSMGRGDVWEGDAEYFFFLFPPIFLISFSWGRFIPRLLSSQFVAATRVLPAFGVLKNEITF